MILKTVTAATTTPVSLQEAKDHLYVTADTWNDDITRKLREAVDFCQRRIPGNRQIMSATYDAVLPEFPCHDQSIRLPVPPLQRIAYVKYYDSSGVLKTWGTTNGTTASTGYYTTVTPTHEPGTIEPAYGKVWPSTRARQDAVTIRFVAGYTSGSAVPGTLKAAVKLKLEHLFDPGRVDEQVMTRTINDLLALNSYGAY